MANITLNCPVCGLPMEAGENGNALTCHACGAVCIPKGPKHPTLYEMLNDSNALRLSGDYDGAVAALEWLYTTNVGKSDAEVSFWLVLAKYGVVLTMDQTGMHATCNRTVEGKVPEDIIARRVVTYCADEARADYARILKEIARDERKRNTPAPAPAPVVPEPVAYVPEVEPEAPVMEEAPAAVAPAVPSPFVAPEAATPYTEPVYEEEPVAAEPADEVVYAESVVAEPVAEPEAPVYEEPAYTEPEAAMPYTEPVQQPVYYDQQPQYPPQQPFFAAPGVVQQSYVPEQPQQPAAPMKGRMEIARKIMFYYEGKDAIVTVPEGVTKIGKDAFRDNDHVREIRLPDGVTEIADFAFNGCDSLEVVILPSSLQYIGKYAFSLCTSIKSIVIPANVHSVGKHAFAHWTKAQTITLGVDKPIWRKDWKDYCAAKIETPSSLQMAKPLAELAPQAAQEPAPAVAAPVVQQPYYDPNMPQQPYYDPNAGQGYYNPNQPR